MTTRGVGLAMRQPLLASLRPQQWVKNLFVFASLTFSHNLAQPGAVARSVMAFAIFCALSGAIYLINDVADVEKDRLHPQKRHRPLAAGQLTVGRALAAAALLLVGGLAGSAWLGFAFLLVALAYVTMLVLYSVRLKNVVILDVLVVAGGFVLRAIAGAVAIGVPISGWLLICTILLALFLALGKRRHEYLTLEEDAARHRPILAEYSPAFLDQMISVVTASTVMAYALYTMSPDTTARFQTHLLPATVPFVLYGIFRYLYLLYRRALGGNPSELFLSDRPLLLNVLCWVLAVLLIIYGTGAPS
jgi:4-hydroxybenzoate polyprenyltransferase